ncbi:hypothetical protein F7R91_22655 [Streptomyces luteolifulvus]|uniref:Uncharacterized protein n=1 Tax=Streptomyces luteolifulvus TaxID=2615112 RepID=A0A6H9UYA3_9ACTN|nr:hypothetical protein [Streptomyces luteolifulvus]KAB1144163.1 hypothetical protein F7R91_22655 [Streptomyces luteolifulvus]
MIPYTTSRDTTGEDAMLEWVGKSAAVFQQEDQADEHGRLSVPGHGEPFHGASIKGGGSHDLHPDVQAAYDRVPEAVKESVGGAHSKCGEAEALSKAMKAGVDPRGGVMAAVNVREKAIPCTVFRRRLARPVNMFLMSWVFGRLCDEP